MNELIIKAKKGDKEAFTQLIFSIEDEIYKIAKTRLQNDEDVFDAIQETMISAYKSIHKLREVNYFKTWFIKILINKCNDIYRKKKVITIDFNEKEIANTDINSVIENLDFNMIMNVLNYDERIAITLYYLEKFTTKEISILLNTNENTIKTRLSRAKNKIKNNYKGDL